MELLKLLIVDDETAMGKAVERALRGYGVHVPEVDLDVEYLVEYVATGEKALDRIESATPDILLLDHKLPGISGLDIISHLTEKPRDLLTIMITAYASLENAIAATRRGAYDFLAKPFTPEELKASIYRTTKHLLLCRQAEKLAREKRRVRFEFISVLAHELKAPLAAVAQYLDILRTADTDAELVQKLAGRSLERIQGMRKLILDLLDVTRLESGQRSRLMVSVDLLQIALAAAEILRSEAAKRGISIHINGHTPCCITADIWEMEAIFNNLISNAVKYNRENGRVDVDVTVTDKWCDIRVTDTGIGISSEDAGRLFNEFARIRNAATDSVTGSGLGLSIVKKIAALYKGEVLLESVPDRGSTFSVRLLVG